MFCKITLCLHPSVQWKSSVYRCTSIIYSQCLAHVSKERWRERSFCLKTYRPPERALKRQIWQHYTSTNITWISHCSSSCQSNANVGVSQLEWQHFSVGVANNHHFRNTDPFQKPEQNGRSWLVRRGETRGRGCCAVWSPRIRLSQVLLTTFWENSDLK